MIELFAALATWRIARMMAHEQGPGNVFERIRAKAALDSRTWIANGFSCVACLSFWVGLVVSALLGGDVLTIGVRGLAFSAASVILMKVVG